MAIEPELLRISVALALRVSKFCSGNCFWSGKVLQWFKAANFADYAPGLDLARLTIGKALKIEQFSDRLGFAEPFVICSHFYHFGFDVTR